MSKTPNFDTKISKILDATKPGERTCSLTGEKWMMTEEEIGWYKKFNVPPSKYSPLTRWFVMNGETVGYEWWWNKHAETGKPILTYVHPASGVKVLPDAEWYQKDFTTLGAEVNATRPFFDQLLDLRRRVPLNATFNVKEPQNSIALLSQGDVNSYFMIACRSKNSLFSSDALDSESSAELYGVKYVTNSFHVIFGERIFNCRYVMHSFDCSNSAFLFDCRNCEYCFGATNQRNKKYLWFNEKLSQEDWERRRSEVKLTSRSVVAEYDRQWNNLLARDAYWPENFSEKSPNCLGEYLRNCTNCQVSFMCFDGPRDNVWACYCYGKAEGNVLVCGAIDGSNNYLGATVLESSDSVFCLNLTRSRVMEYCINCINSEFCFGCVGLNRKKYCILNKPYTEGEYWQKLDELKCRLLDAGEYGEFFPTAFSTSYFPESVAGINLGATVTEEGKYGFAHFDPESAGAIGELGDAALLKDSLTVPDDIADLSTEAWAGVALLDKQAGRRFAYLRPELEFYKTFGIAPPTNHFIARVDDLYRTANLFILEDAVCAKCHKALKVAKNATFKNRRHLCRECYLWYLEEHG